VEPDHTTSQERGPEVSPSQRLAIEVLLAGGNDAEAAKAASVARETVCRWRHGDADFIAALNRERQAVFEATRDRLCQASLKAIEALSNALSADDVSLRLRAASVILRSFGPHGPAIASGDTDPEEIRAKWSEAQSQREIRALSPFT
jgi:hypothetical protein